MKPLRTWLARLGVFGALAIVSGCGSGDVPDPGADGEVAQLPDAPPPVLAQPAPAAAQNQDVAAADKPAEGKAEDAKPEETTAQAQPAAPAVAESASPPPAEPSAAAAPAPDRDSATAEMLAMATKAQPAPAPAADAAPDAAPATPAGGAPAPAGGGPGPGGGAMNMGPGMGRMNMGPNAPGAGGMNPGQMQAGMQPQMQMQQQMQGQMQARMQGGPGGPGGGMGPGGGPPGMGGNANSKPPDTHTPEGAVQAFLDALKARDLGRLTEATALRAQNEAVKHNQEMFKRIFDGSLSKAEIDELAAKLDGFKITSFNPPKSTGRLDIIVSKRLSNGNRVTIKITTRREKKGWGVSDISNPAELKNPRMGPIRSQPKR